MKVENHLEIRKYEEHVDYDNLIELLRSEQNWDWFLGKAVIGKHKKSLKESITYVACIDDQVIGYTRSLEDIESYIYVCELLVRKEFRGRSMGKDLLERLVLDYPDHEVLVMSDEDSYYKKLGYAVEGSIFKVSVK